MQKEKRMTVQTRKIQTAFRLDSALLNRAKRKAREQSISLNHLVEKAVESYVGSFQFPEVKIPERIPDWILDLSKEVRPFTKEELEADDRLAYILSK